MLSAQHNVPSKLSSSCHQWTLCQHSHDQIGDLRKSCGVFNIKRWILYDIYDRKTLLWVYHKQIVRGVQSALLNMMVIRNYLVLADNGQYVTIVMTGSQTCHARMWPEEILLVFNIRHSYYRCITSRLWAQRYRLWSHTLLWWGCNSYHVISIFPGFTDVLSIQR